MVSVDKPDTLERHSFIYPESSWRLPEELRRSLDRRLRASSSQDLGLDKRTQTDGGKCSS